MADYDWINWLSWILVIVVNGAMVYLIWWALFADRSRGRRRCPRCWYNMQHSPGMTCPECGFTAQHESHLHRTRRRPRPAVVGLLVCLLTAAAINQRMSQRGWASTIPNALLIFALPASSPNDGALTVELNRRLNTGRLSDRNLVQLMRRAARGDWWTQPVSERWINKYGRLIWMQRSRLQPPLPPPPERDTPGDEAPVFSDAERPLLEIPPLLELTGRNTWPTDTPIAVTLRMREWWPLDTRCRLTVAPRIGGFDPFILERTNRPGLGSDHTLVFDDWDETQEELIVDTKLERRLRDAAESDPWTLVDQQTLRLPIQCTGAVADVLKPVTAPQLDLAIQSTFARGIVKYTGGPGPIRYQFTPQATQASQFQGIAIGVTIDLMRNGQAVQSLDIWWQGGTQNAGLGWKSNDALDDADALVLLNQHADGWKLRITGKPELALRAGDGPVQYWTGQFTIPAIINGINNEAPSPHWWETAD